MSVESLLSDERGSSELVYIAIVAGIVVSIGAAGITLSDTITSSTEQRVQETNFELSDRGDLEITYTSSSTLSPARVYAMNDNGIDYTVYDGELKVQHPSNTYNRSIEEGNVVFNGRIATETGIGYGDTVTFVIEDSSGSSYVADEVPIPPQETISLDERGSDGNVSIEGSTLDEEVQLNTTASNTS